MDFLLIFDAEVQITGTITRRPFTNRFPRGSSSRTIRRKKVNGPNLCRWYRLKFGGGTGSDLCRNPCLRVTVTWYSMRLAYFFIYGSSHLLPVYICVITLRYSKFGNNGDKIILTKEHFKYIRFINFDFIVVWMCTKLVNFQSRV